MNTSNSKDPSKPVHILFVDDDPAFAKVVRAVLQLSRQHTFILTWKESVESAIAEIKQNHEIDIILMDYYFPTSNGLEFCLQLNQLERSIPIIFLTGAHDFKLAVEAMKLGVEEFLLKDDLDQTNLPRTILGILEHVRLRKHKQAVEKRLTLAENRAQAIRELVVTVCHEFNNPLAAIKIAEEKRKQSARSIAIISTGKEYLFKEKIIPANIKSRLFSAVKSFMANQEERIIKYFSDLKTISLEHLKQSAASIETLGNNLVMLSPENVMKRGYTLTSLKSQIIKNAGILKDGDIIDTKFSDGSVRSKVMKNQ